MPMFRSTKTFEARQVSDESVSTIARWCDGDGEVCSRIGSAGWYRAVCIRIDDSYWIAAPGDWVVRSPEGVFSVWANEKFVKAYEPEEQS